MPTPPKPSEFTPQGAPVGVEVKHVLFPRPKLKSPARLILIHTNAARSEGSVESSWNWAHAKPNNNTCPHYQVDRSGRARKMVFSDEDAIANGTVLELVPPAERHHGDVSEWSIAIETADTGTDDDPSISDFTEEQIETIAQIVAYEHLVPGSEIPLVTPDKWFGAGVAGHTDPFGFPYWTRVQGKSCPGAKKKASIRNRILPRAREIVAAWTATVEEEDMPLTDTEIKKIAEAVWAHRVATDDKGTMRPMAWLVRQIWGQSRRYLGGWKVDMNVPETPRLLRVLEGVEQLLKRKS